VKFFSDFIQGVFFVVCCSLFVALVIFVLHATKQYGDTAQVAVFAVLLAVAGGIVNALANRSINGIRTAAGLPIPEPSNFSKAIWTGAKCAFVTLLLTAVVTWLGWLWLTVYPQAEQMGEYVENVVQISLIVLSGGVLVTTVVMIVKFFFPDTNV
jgi:hypothetical protein